MASSSSSSSSVKYKLTGSLTRSTSVMAAPSPLLRIIHLDTGGGGDCTVFIGKTSFVVIDGGKAGTGKRLIKLMEHLISKGKELVLCVVSHYDTDHYGGLFTALIMLTEGQISSLKIVSPVGKRYVHKDKMNASDQTDARNALDKKDSQKSTIGCAINALLRAHPHANFEDPPDTFTFDGWTMTLKGGKSDLIQQVAEENNASSLMWLFSHEKTTTTYYTGGDSESGPISATIVKLDHHGSNTNGCNAKLKSFNAELTKVAIVMGPGMGHKHPALEVMTMLTNKKIAMVSTHHHFDDWPDGEKDGLIGRHSEIWGDIGVAIYQNERFKIDVRDGFRQSIGGSGMGEDTFLSELLKVTRKCTPGPAIAYPIARGAKSEKLQGTCNLKKDEDEDEDEDEDVTCSGEVEELDDIEDFRGGYACEFHRSKCLAMQIDKLARRQVLDKNKEAKMQEQEEKRYGEDDDYNGGSSTSAKSRGSAPVTRQRRSVALKIQTESLNQSSSSTAAVSSRRSSEDIHDILTHNSQGETSTSSAAAALGRQSPENIIIPETPNSQDETPTSPTAAAFSMQSHAGIITPEAQTPNSQGGTLTSEQDEHLLDTNDQINPDAPRSARKRMKVSGN